MTTAERIVCRRGGPDCRLVRNHDEVECSIHGLVYTPTRAWDVAGDDLLDKGERPEATRKPSRHMGNQVNPDEAAALAAIERGDRDALDEDEWDAAIQGPTSAQRFIVRQRCPGCGKRTLIPHKGCTVCERGGDEFAEIVRRDRELPRERVTMEDGPKIHTVADIRAAAQARRDAIGAEMARANLKVEALKVEMRQCDRVLAAIDGAPEKPKAKSGKMGPQPWTCPDCGHETTTTWAGRHREKMCNKRAV